MIALLLFLFQLPRLEWYLLGITVALGAALLAWELRAPTPFLDIRLLASNKALTRTYLRLGLLLLCVYVVLYGVTQWIEAVRGLNETEAGLVLLPMTLVTALVVSPVSRRNLVRGRSSPRAHLPGRLGRRPAAQRLGVDRRDRHHHDHLRCRHGLRRRRQ